MNVAPKNETFARGPGYGTIIIQHERVFVSQAVDTFIHIPAIRRFQHPGGGVSSRYHHLSGRYCVQITAWIRIFLWSLFLNTLHRTMT